jgi:phosphate transport system substrate-binding protein
VKITRIGAIATLALVGTLALSSCAVNEQPAGNGSDQPGGLSGTLVGAGASSQQSAQEAWVAAFQIANPDVTIEYDPVGSGGGRDTFIAGGSQFAGSDRAFKVDEVEADEFGACVPGTGIVEIPAYISPIAIIFNVDGVDALNLDAPTIAGIFSGKITTWNDPAIASQNEGVSLPAQQITAVHRGDDSGTTANFTDYLSVVAPEVWTVGSIESWPSEFGGEAANQTSGMVDAVTNGTGTIGYADASRAGDLGTVAVKVGDEYVPYAPEAAAAIVDASPLEEGRGEHDLAVALERDSTASGVYPVVLVSYLIACTEYADGAPVELLKAYLSYVVSEDGQQAGHDAAGSAPISDSLREQAVAAIDAIK